VLKGSTQIVDPGPSFQCDDVEYCDVMMSRDVIYDVTTRRAIDTFLWRVD